MDKTTKELKIEFGVCSDSKCYEKAKWCYKGELFCQEHITASRFNQFVGKYINPIVHITTNLIVKKRL